MLELKFAKTNKRGGPNKVRGDGKNFQKSMSGGTFIKHRNTRSTTNVVLDANNRAEISKISSYKVPKINTVSFRKESFRWLGPMLLDSLPEETKHTKSVDVETKSQKY